MRAAATASLEDRSFAVASEAALLSDRDFRRAVVLIYQHAGITLGDSKRELVRARLAKRLRATGCKSYGEYLDRWIDPATASRSDATAAEFTHFVDALSTNLTSFFREATHFTYLQDVYLPQRIAEGERTGRRTLRAWCAACSSGEEAYTLAMTLLESLPARGWDVKLLATDICTKVLSTAAAGVYPTERAAGIPRALAGKYFAPRRLPNGAAALAAVPELRSMIRFRHLNLIADWPFTGPFDFVFCRNVMIYFDKPTQERLVNRFHSVIAPGGLLFTGHSESLTGLKHPFSYTQATIYRK